MNTKQLKDWRKQSGLTQVEAARLIGCSRRALQHYEAGRRIPKHIAMALAAVAAELEPYGGK